ncbi:MAG: hypothetical protein ACI8TP_003371 [Acidimicrobiales bacterium]
MSFSNAPHHRFSSTPNLDPLVVPLLAEHCQQHNPSIRTEEIRDAPGRSTEIETQLDQTIPE